MKPITIEFHDSSKTPLYIQLYRHIKEEITRGTMPSGEKPVSYTHLLSTWYSLKIGLPLRRTRRMLLVSSVRLG